MKTEEFAELIGVSRVTLSKVLNGRPGVSKETEDKVKGYIKKYNFVPNNSARTLAGKKNNILGLFLKVPSVIQNEAFTSSHFSTEFTNYVINEVQKRNYKLLVATADAEYEEIERCFKSGLITGAILFGYSKNDINLKKITAENNKVLIVNQEEKSPLKNVKIVNVDDYNGSIRAMEELMRNERKNLLYIGSETKRLAAIRREKGVRDFYEKNKDKVQTLRIANGNFTRQSGYEIMLKILEEDLIYPDGIFAANDFMAIGAIAAVKEKGLKIPEDISVVGFDNIEISKYIDPPLSTISYNFEDIAKKSVNTLIDFIEEKKVRKVQECKTMLVRRETSLKVREAEIDEI